MEQTEIDGMNIPKKVVLFGPESTGKTKLSERLANAYQTVTVPEFARLYLESKLNYIDTSSRGANEICSFDDLMPIVTGQCGLEDYYLQQKNKVVFFDTNPLQTWVYSHYYFQKIPPYLESILHQRTYDHYLLLQVDVPWIEDPLRDRPHARENLFQHFKNTLAHLNLPYTLIEGNFEQRFEKACLVVDQICGKS